MTVDELRDLDELIKTFADDHVWVGQHRIPPGTALFETRRLIHEAIKRAQGEDR